MRTQHRRVVAYRQVAFSFVAQSSTSPASFRPASVPDGDPFDRTGGVVSVGDPEYTMRRSVPPYQNRRRNRSPPGPIFRSTGLAAPVHESGSTGTPDREDHPLPWASPRYSCATRQRKKARPDSWPDRSPFRRRRCQRSNRYRRHRILRRRPADCGCTRRQAASRLPAQSTSRYTC